MKRSLVRILVVVAVRILVVVAVRILVVAVRILVAAVRILVVAANLRMRPMKTEAEKGSMQTAGSRTRAGRSQETGRLRRAGARAPGQSGTGLHGRSRPPARGDGIRDAPGASPPSKLTRIQKLRG